MMNEMVIKSAACCLSKDFMSNDFFFLNFRLIIKKKWRWQYIACSPNKFFEFFIFNCESDYIGKLSIRFVWAGKCWKKETKTRKKQNHQTCINNIIMVNGYRKTMNAITGRNLFVLKKYISIQVWRIWQILPLTWLVDIHWYQEFDKH